MARVRLYAQEILTAEGGCGLDGLLRQRMSDLTGILNGSDYRLWDPASDPRLVTNFSWSNLSGKRACKAALQNELGLPAAPDTPLIVYLSRVTGQKMADVVLETLPVILQRSAQLVIHGRGDYELEQRFRDAGRKWSDRLSIRIGYDENLAHRLQAGADVLLHPSQFEPCGLTQLYALRYGTLPIVRSVGGLADTVVDTSNQTLRSGSAMGFAFREPSAAAMLACIDRALTLYRQPVVWRKLQQRAMRQDFGWSASAQNYLELYHRLAPATLQRETEAVTIPLSAGAAG